MHNQIASVVSMAKALRMALDQSHETITVPVPTLRLLIDTFVELAERDNPTANKIAEKSAAFVASRIAGLER